MNECIVVDDVTKSFCTNTVVNRMTVAISQGEVFGILGHNGAGKTTLVEMMLGLKQPDSGTIHVFGHSMKHPPRTLFDTIGVQLQNQGYQNNIRGTEVCEEAQVLYQHPAKLSSLYEQFQMREQLKQPVTTLSGGEMQKLSLICALIPNPKLLFLDELTTGLDPYARKEVWEILRERKQMGTTIVMTTHDLEEVEALCDRIMIMKKGRCLFLGTIREVLNRCNVRTLEEAYFTIQKEEIQV